MDVVVVGHLSFGGSGKPSCFQDMCGVGLPEAEHFRDTLGPGCIVCSMNLYCSVGAASARTSREE